jgi:O-antigen ligase
MVLRWALRGRLWTLTPLDGWLLAFVALGIVNVYAAPYESRGLLMLARPLLGMALLLYLVELARTTGSLDVPLAAGLALALVVGLLALGGTQWPGKAEAFDFLTEGLPRARPFFAPGGFNPNEIAGALAWLAPLAAGLTAYPWRRFRRGLQGLAGVITLLLLAALMMGQSRSAIIGVLAALVVVLLAFRTRRGRYVALGMVVALMILQASILLGVFSDRQATASPLSSPNLTTLRQRFAIWESALAMTGDHPLTGVGMDRFRYGPVTADYPIRGITRTMPHTHNEFIQITTDLGLPGLVVFSAWHIITAYMLAVCWRRAIGERGWRRWRSAAACWPISSTASPTRFRCGIASVSYTGSCWGWPEDNTPSSARQARNQRTQPECLTRVTLPALPGRRESSFTQPFSGWVNLFREGEISRQGLRR